jgi:hypothetical protein
MLRIDMRWRSWRHGLVLGVVLVVVGAVGAGSAMAETMPYFVIPKEKVTFTGKSIGTVKIASPGLLGGTAVVDCLEGGTVSGEFTTGKQMTKTVMTLSRCETKGLVECGNVNAKTIQTEPLSSELGYLKKPGTGLMLGTEYKHKTGEKRPPWASRVTCGVPFVEENRGPLLGERIGVITPVNKRVTKAESYTFTMKGIGINQENTQFEGGATEQELFWSLEPAGGEAKWYIEGIFEVKVSSAESEIKA